MDQHDKISILRASHTLAKMGSIESRRGTADATSSEGQVAKREDSQERADYRSLELRARERRVPNARNSSLCFGTLYGSSETSHRRSTAPFSQALERVAAYLQVATVEEACYSKSAGRSHLARRLSGPAPACMRECAH